MERRLRKLLNQLDDINDHIKKLTEELDERQDSPHYLQALSLFSKGWRFIAENGHGWDWDNSKLALSWWGSRRSTILLSNPGHRELIWATHLGTGTDDASKIIYHLKNLSYQVYQPVPHHSQPEEENRCFNPNDSEQPPPRWSDTNALVENLARQFGQWCYQAGRQKLAACSAYLVWWPNPELTTLVIHVINLRLGKIPEQIWNPFVQNVTSAPSLGWQAVTTSPKNSSYKLEQMYL